MLNLNNISLKHWWFTFALLSTILALNLLPSDIEELLDLKHAPINQGEWWRILSSQIMHLSFNHTVLNFAGYAFVVFSFREEIPPGREIVILLIAASGVGLGIYFLNPDMYSYVGLSGAIYGVLVAYVIIGINKTPGLSLIFLTFIIGKFIFEHFNGGAASETESFIGGRVATDSHLYGAITGILPGIIYFLFDRKNLIDTDTLLFVDQFKNPIVRDLAWALHSAPLLNINAPQFSSVTPQSCRDFAISFRSPLKELDRNPDKLLTETNPNQARLGIYFEALIKYWLNHQDRFDLIEHNLRIEHDKKTIGEFDFIIKDNQTQETMHWETAIKFYLGTSKLESPDDFYGPGRKDRLDIKTDHMVKKQIQLSNKPEATSTLKEKNILIDKKLLFVKGRLFYPYNSTKPGFNLLGILSPSHIRHRWYTLNQFLNAKPSDINIRKWPKPTFHIADKSEWLTFKNQNSYTLNDLKSHLRENPIVRPTIIIIARRQKELTRLFIVPNNWEEVTL